MRLFDFDDESRELEREVERLELLADLRDRLAELRQQSADAMPAVPEADAGRVAAFEDPEITERKRRLRDLYERGASRTESERVLNLSASTVKRMSRDMGLNWRIKTAER